MRFKRINMQYSLKTASCIGGAVSLILICLQIITTNCPPHQFSLRYSQTYDGFHEKPTLLLWFWPMNYTFNLTDCKDLFSVDGCVLTDDRSLYSEADAVLIFHRAINHDLSNLPLSPRPAYQRWIWFHVESPTNTIRIPGLENLFNLTLNYRQDADIVVRNHLTVRKSPEKKFIIPKKDKLVCWIVSNKNPMTGTGVRERFYKQLKKYIKVHVFGKAFGHFLKYEDYYPTIASCKFYLSFENSIHKDYITEKLNGPLAVGTVPIVLGPPRENYENFVPSNSFIHVNDFPTARALAQYIFKLHYNDRLYLRYFEWRKYLSARRHLIEQNQEFIPPICTACDYVGRHNEYKTKDDIYEWYFS